MVVHSLLGYFLYYSGYNPPALAQPLADRLKKGHAKCGMLHAQEACDTRKSNLGNPGALTALLPTHLLELLLLIRPSGLHTTGWHLRAGRQGEDKGMGQVGRQAAGRQGGAGR